MISEARIVSDAQQCALLFRLGRDIEAALKTVELIEAAMPLIVQRPLPAQQAWAQVLSAILACQERQDWIGVADWLEYEWVTLVGPDPSAHAPGAPSQ
ncbi:hypothetical protein [Pseudomonas sp. efr-133-TYG-103a]|uniref:hypothetical protein n=1 Tax=Pseudomonas sp. efr-133-TYG-103a TaxID=3040308 RepID=UPI00255712F4|nr:hypothetical protein [Pseudomonas sp. efr-133-TYG-103a]